MGCGGNTDGSNWSRFGGETGTSMKAGELAVSQRGCWCNVAISPTTLSWCKGADFNICGTLRRCRRTVDVAPVAAGDNRVRELVAARSGPTCAPQGVYHFSKRGLLLGLEGGLRRGRRAGNGGGMKAPDIQKPPETNLVPKRNPGTS